MKRILLLVALSALFATPVLRAQSFEGLGFLDATNPVSYANDVSADGAVVVGYSFAATGQGTTTGGAYRWEGSMQALPYTYPEFPYGNSASGVSANGAVTVGWSAGAIIGQQIAATRWVGTSPQDVGPPFYSAAFAASADGEVVVGQASTQTLRWDGSPQVIEINSQSAAHDVSADGAVMVGYAFFDNNGDGGAYRWEDGEVEFLPGFPGDPDPSISANGITPDGTIIVGESALEGEPHMARWTNGVAEDLGPGVALSTSADGNIVVGHDAGPIDRRAVIWRPAAGVQDLRSFLVDSLGLDLTGWTLTRANAVSDDGSTIVGDGVNPSGNLEAWRATLRSVLTVNVTEDDADTDADDAVCDADAVEPGNQCTLRAAIETALADDAEEAVAIGFNIEGEGPHMISLDAPLPTVTRPIKLDGTTEPDYQPGTDDEHAAPSVFLTGGGAVERGLVIATDSSLVRGLGFGGFSVAAVEVTAGPGPHRVEENWFGLDPSGTAAMPNGIGIRVNNAPGVQIGGEDEVQRNAISGNTTAGVQVAGADAVDTVVSGNWIGVTPDGEAALPNAIGVDATGVPGLVVEKNTILAGQAGIRLAALDGEPTTDARIVANVLGLLPNNQLPPSGPSDGFGVIVQHAEGTLVGEATEQPGWAPGNTISGWNAGVLVIGNDEGGGLGTRIAGNLVGLDTTGTVARPNRVGVWVAGAADDTRVGGWETGERNVISGSTSTTGNGSGIAVTSGDGADATGEPTGTVIVGNYIGTDIMGVEDVGNQKSGILVGPFPGGTGGVSDVFIGATAAMAPGAPPERRRNVIAFSGDVNVMIDRTGAVDEEPVHVVGNWIGLDANGDGGVTLSTIGSATPVGVKVQGVARATVGGAGEDGNVISGQRIGVWIDADESEVVGNRIGTDSEGLERRANFAGVAVSGSRVTVGRTQDGTAMGNVISGNVLVDAPDLDGISDGMGVLAASSDIVELIIGSAALNGWRSVGTGLAFPNFASQSSVASMGLEAAPGGPERGGAEPAEDNVVAHNLIGTTPAGDAAVVPTDDVNDSAGIFVSSGAEGTQIYANTLSGTSSGLIISAPGNVPVTTFPAGTLVAGNRIGLAAGGGDDDYVPNRRFGVVIGGAEDTVIGEGAVAGQGANRIAGTGADGSGLPPPASAPGIYLVHPSDAPDDWPTGGSTLRQNLIYGNEGLAITRDADLGVTPNDEDNNDGVASFNFPRVLQAIDDGTTLSIIGTSSVPMAVEVFADRPCDDSGHGEGRFYLGTVQAADGVFEGVVDNVPFRDWRVAVTGTNVNGTTSEFSPCQSVSAPGETISVPIADGETPSVDGPDMTIEVTENAPNLVAAGMGAAKPIANRPAGSAGARLASGTLYAGLHQSRPDEGPFEGTATGDDGTPVTPNGVQRQRSWSVQSDSLDGLVFEACLRYDNLFSLPVPEQLIVVTRPERGEPWAAHDSFLRSAGDEAYLCAGGLSAFGEYAIGADSLVNPVPNEPEPGDGPTEAAPTTFALSSAYPNPFNPSTVFRLDVPLAGRVRVDVFDMLGRRVAILQDGDMGAGSHTMRFEARDLPSGVYVVRATSVGVRQARSVTLVR